jgi:hypothetical protein
MQLSTTAMSLQKPSFQSNLPDYLLQDTSPKERYILEHLSIISQNNVWLVDETIKQSEKLESIECQTIRTNGRVSKLEEKNISDKDSDEQIKQIVNTKLFIEKYLLNKYFLISFVFFIVGIIKVVLNDDLRTLFLKVIGI